MENSLVKVFQYRGPTKLWRWMGNSQFCLFCLNCPNVYE